MKLFCNMVTIFSLIICIGTLPLHAHEGKDHGVSEAHSVTAGEKTFSAEAPAACQYCNMNRTKFAHSRSLVDYEDGTKVGTCSINCSVIDLNANAGKKVKKVSVADYKSKKLIDAKSATWVIGGSVRGIMTKTAKWAFSGKKDADAFVKESGGKIATYEEVVAAAKEEIAARGASKKQGHNAPSGHGGHEKKL